MRRSTMVAAGLALVAGCAGDMPAEDEAYFPPGPLPGETYPDPSDPDVEACVTVVSLYTRSAGIVATGLAPGADGGRVVSLAGDRGRWRCEVDEDGRVTAMVPRSGA